MFVFVCLIYSVLFCPVEAHSIYRNNLKNREFGEEGPQNCDSERVTIAQGQGTSENHNSEVKPTPPKPDFSGCFGINGVSTEKEQGHFSIGPEPEWVVPCEDALECGAPLQRDYVAIEDLKSYWAITRDITRRAPSSIEVVENRIL